MKNCSEDQLNDGRIEIKLNDKAFFKSAMIGYYETSMSYVYQQDKHAIMHKYLVMNNPESEDYGKVTGYLKISITVTGGDDVPVPIEEDPNPNSEDLLLPAEIKPTFY